MAKKRSEKNVIIKSKEWGMYFPTVGKKEYCTQEKALQIIEKISKEPQVVIKSKSGLILVIYKGRTNLQYADLTSDYLKEANLRGENLTQASLTGADLRDADLRKVCFDLADLYCANLEGADLRGADLTRANCIEANFSNADLRDANLDDFEWGHVILEGAKISNKYKHKIVSDPKDL